MRIAEDVQTACRIAAGQATSGTCRNNGCEQYAPMTLTRQHQEIRYIRAVFYEFKAHGSLYLDMGAVRPPCLFLLSAGTPADKNSNQPNHYVVPKTCCRVATSALILQQRLPVCACIFEAAALRSNQVDLDRRLIYPVLVFSTGCTMCAASSK